MQHKNDLSQVLYTEDKFQKLVIFEQFVKFNINESINKNSKLSNSISDVFKLKSTKGMDN